MKNFVVIPDSFKGSLSSKEACLIIESELSKKYPTSKVFTFPVADGGEGTVDCFLHSIKNSTKIYAKTVDAFLEDLNCYYGCFYDRQNTKTAIIELACCCGLPQAEAKNILNPGITSTYGLGLLIKDAIHNDCKKIILGLGGSSTNDCGCGIAYALGTKFYDDKNQIFCPTGNNLCKISKIDISQTKELLKDIDIIAMCDIENPLYGNTGAAYVYAPQKGANQEQVESLDKGLQHIANIILKDLQIDVQKISGSGAAGGCGAGVKAFLDGTLQSGIHTVLDLINFQQIIKELSDNQELIIITGEGKLDYQSFFGKVVGSICQTTMETLFSKAKVYAVCGIAKDLPSNWQSKGLTNYFIINPPGTTFEEAKKHAKENLSLCIKNNF